MGGVSLFWCDDFRLKYLGLRGQLPRVRRVRGGRMVSRCLGCQVRLSLGVATVAGCSGLPSQGVWGGPGYACALFSVRALPCPAVYCMGKTDQGGGTGSRAPLKIQS